MKRVISILLILTMIIGSMPYYTFAATNPYPVNNWGSTGEWSNCTWSVWKLAYDNLGIELPNWGNAGYGWITNARNAGYSTGNTPQRNSIIVMDGHVAFVTDISGDGSQVYIKEGGYGYAPNQTYHEGWCNAYGSRQYTGQAILGYIYLSSSMSSVDVGSDFYAYIINTSTWLLLTNDSNNVSVRKETGRNNQIWHFLRQDDGSYKIVNCEDNYVLDVHNFGTVDGTNVQVCQSNDTNAQRWYISGESGAYYFRPKCANKNLDVVRNSDQEGTNVQIFTPNDTPAQKFQIWTLNKPAASILTCSAGTTERDTIFTWTKTTDTKWYDIKIWNGTCWVGDAYKIQWGETGTQWSVRLPEGYYEAYVDSCNGFAGTMSNLVKFTVKYESPQSTNPSLSPKPSESIPAETFAPTDVPSLEETYKKNIVLYTPVSGIQEIPENNLVDNGGFDFYIEGDEENHYPWWFHDGLEITNEDYITMGKNEFSATQEGYSLKCDMKNLEQDSIAIASSFINIEDFAPEQTLKFTFYMKCLGDSAANELSNMNIFGAKNEMEIEYATSFTDPLAVYNHLTPGVLDGWVRVDCYIQREQMPYVGPMILYILFAKGPDKNADNIYYIDGISAEIIPEEDVPEVEFEEETQVPTDEPATEIPTTAPSTDEPASDVPSATPGTETPTVSESPVVSETPIPIDPDLVVKKKLAKPAIKKIKSVKKNTVKITLKKKISGAKKFQVKIAAKKSFKKAKTVKVKAKKIFKVKHKLLKKGKKIYFKVKALKTSKKKASSYSEVKNSKMK